MKNFVPIIALSLAANVALFAYWQRPAARLQNAAPSSPAATIAAPVKTEAPPADAPAATPEVAAQTSPSKPRWIDFQSTDLKEYIARLRAVGCPEETIQDIILAEVRRRFAARGRTLFPEDESQQAYWKASNNDYKASRERARKQRELADEEVALLVELFGFNPRTARNEGDEWSDGQSQPLSFLPESKRTAVQNFLDGFDEKMEDFDQKNQGVWDAQRRAEKRVLEEEKERGLAAMLTPEEFRQWELRTSDTASQLQSELHGLPLSEEEYQRFFEIRKKYGDSIYNWADLDTKEERDAVKHAKDSLQVDIRLVLGDARAKEYTRAQEYEYQQLKSIAKRNDLAVDTAAKLYDFKSAAEDSAKQIRTDKSLTPEARRTALQSIYDETQQAVKTSLGDKAFKSYERNGGYWLNNLKPPPPPTTKK